MSTKPHPDYAETCASRYSSKSTEEKTQGLSAWERTNGQKCRPGPLKTEARGFQAACCRAAHLRQTVKLSSSDMCLLDCRNPSKELNAGTIAYGKYSSNLNFSTGSRSLLRGFDSWRLPGLHFTQNTKYTGLVRIGFGGIYVY